MPPYSDDNGFQELIDTTLAYTTSQDSHQDEDSEMAPEYPIAFYDRHLTADLTLKKVQISPSMVHVLSDLCDSQIGALRAAGPSHWGGRDVPGSHRGPSFRTSWDVATAYKDNLGEFCHPFPSKSFFHPHHRNLMSVFEFVVAPTSSHRPAFLMEAYFSVRFPFYNRHDPAYILEKDHRVSLSSITSLKELGTHSPMLAIWEFYPMNISGEKVIKKMDNIEKFMWDIPRTTGLESPFHCSPSFPDDQGDFVELLRKTLTTSRRKSHTTGTPRKNKSSGKRPGEVVPSFPWRPTRTDRPYRVNPAHFLQHAWTRAVANDATFLVFNCGKYERIGFRHRASQTLYLSELIDTVNGRDPTYGKLHVGLYYAIVQDALNRQQLRLLPPSINSPVGVTVVPSHTKKTTTKSVPSSKKMISKRRKPATAEESTESETNALYTQAISSALSTRDLALVCLNYGVFQSSQPSSFIRRKPSCLPEFRERCVAKPDRKAKYLPHQYFSLTLSQSIDKGATGTVHRASAEIQLESGATVKHPMIIKLVFLDRETRPDDQIRDKEETEEDRLYHEYSIYQHLASAGVVEGILPVYGLFEDIDSGTLALIMEDGGTSLKRRELEATGGSSVITVISKTESAVLIRTIKKIHESGIRHRDIRTENIVVNSKHGACIIDFDRAEFLPPTCETLDRELRCMQHIVDGHPNDGSYYSF